MHRNTTYTATTQLMKSVSKQQQLLQPLCTEDKSSLYATWERCAVTLVGHGLPELLCDEGHERVTELQQSIKAVH